MSRRIEEETEERACALEADAAQSIDRLDCSLCGRTSMDGVLGVEDDKNRLQVEPNSQSV